MRSLLATAAAPRSQPSLVLRAEARLRRREDVTTIATGRFTVS